MGWLGVVVCSDVQGCVWGSTLRVPRSGFKGLKLKRQKEIFQVGGNLSSKWVGVCPKRAGRGGEAMGTLSPPCIASEGSALLPLAPAQGNRGTEPGRAWGPPGATSGSPFLFGVLLNRWQKRRKPASRREAGLVSRIPMRALHHLSPSLPNATPGGDPAASPLQPRGRGPLASGMGESWLCQRSSGRGQGRRGLSGCPPAAADLRGML